MTNEVTYREKGRAAFLAALMVLSVFAMAASFSGAVAADSHTEQDLQENSRYWQGQTIVVQPDDVDNNNSGSFASNETYEIINNETGALERQISVESGEDNFTIVTNRLETGQYDIEDEAGDLKNQFRVDVQRLDVTDDSETSATVGGSADITLDSQRSNYAVVVSSDDLSQSELEGVFSDYGASTSESYLASDEVALTGVDSIQDLTLNFDESEFSAGTYSFDFSAADTTASDSYEVELQSADAPSANFDANTYEEEVGDVAEFTVQPTNTDNVYVNITEEGENYQATLQLSNYGDADEITVAFNTYLANETTNGTVNGDVFSSEEADVKVIDVESSLGDNRILPADLEMESYTEDPRDASTDETDAAILILNDRSTDDINTWVAPADYSVNDDLETILGAATQSNSVADGDLFVAEVQASGVYGYLTDSSDNLTTAEGLELTFTDTHDPKYGTPDEFSVNELVEKGNAKIVPVPEDDTFFVVADLSSSEVDADETWTAEFAVNEDNGYVDSSEDAESVSQNFDVETRNIEFDAEFDDEDRIQIENSANSELTVNTNVAPGTEVTYRVRFETSVTSASAVVGDDGTATASWDFSDRTAGEEVRFVRATETGGNEKVETSGVIVDAGAPDAITVEGDAPAEVNVNESASLDVTVTNPDADTEQTTSYTVTIDDEVVDEDELTLAAGEEVTNSYDFDTTAEGDIDWEVTTDAASDSGTLAVNADDGNGEENGTENGEENGTENGEENGAENGEENGTENGEENGNENGEEDSEDDGTPGFGVAVAAIAMLAAAMLALRRQH